MKHFNRILSLTVLLAVGISLGAQGSAPPANAQTAFADPAFQRTWERTDKPVADHKAQRSWYWGPTPGFSTMEPDKDAPGGQRLVQYFDKSRMEINNPNGDKNSAFYVTNGLLATELMTGQMQVGNSTFESRCTAGIPLASDTNDSAAPTYATFGKLLAQPKSNLVGQKATTATDKDGNLSAAAGKGSVPDVGLVYYEPRTGRNIPKVFWEFLNAQGPIYKSGALTTGKLNDPWYFASGLPVTEAYWANVKIDGKLTDVLIQAYERRVLTYVPANIGTPFAVQMGNVGQHYYDWRYKGQGCNGPAPSSSPTAVPTVPGPVACDQGVPDAKSATITPRCGPVGTVFNIHASGFTPAEKLSLWITQPDGRVLGTPRPLDAGNHPGAFDDVFDSSVLQGGGSSVEGIWAITYEGELSKHQSIVWFKISPATAPTPAPTAPPGATPGPPAACDTNGQHDATSSPGSATKGTPIHITISGFRGGEQASYWLTDPDGAVFGTQQTLTIPSSGGGTLTINTALLYAGRWALTVHGLSSGHEAVGVFCITP